jgi:membrane-bound lytic murein transglycosylase D
MFLLQSRSKIILAVLSCCTLIAMYSVPLTVTEEHISSLVSVAPSKASIGSLWNNISGELKLDHRADSAPVKAEIRKLLADHDKLNSILKAAGPYIYFIHAQIEARGLPVELALIPIIESEYNPNDHSTKGATGLWQLMPETGRELGIKVKSNYDGRRNVVASTKAALAYFNDLGKLFNNNWYLAIAAYNCGQVTIESAIRRAGSHSFWNLHVSKETKFYVPRLLAVAEIIKNPKKYGITLPPLPNKPYFAELKMKRAVSLAQVAKTSGIDLATLKQLNPDYNHPVVPVKGAYTLLVPINEAPRALQKLSASVVI